MHLLTIIDKIHFMRILHTADIHFGQNIYQHYERLDEHLHFFSQLKNWIEMYSPDVLLISGDIFDVAQPAASVWSAFNNQIVELRKKFPYLSIVIVAGNHDSASRIESHSQVWKIGGVTVIGTPPPLFQAAPEGWEEKYILRLPSGFVIAVPYISGDRADTIIHLQDYVSKINTENLPVVMTSHLTATGSDTEGHDMSIGNIRSISVDRLGDGYDYLALGHIHKAQTLGHEPVFDESPHTYPAPIARYSGSALHVSENENYPHSVSLVNIEKHADEVEIRQLRINQLRHFETLPNDRPNPFMTAREAIAYLKKYIKKSDNTYIRFRFIQGTEIPADFNTSVYSLIERSVKDIRYNPRMIFVSPDEESGSTENTKQKFEVEEIKQMSNPLEFVIKTADTYSGLTKEDLESLFGEVEMELTKVQEGQ